jgi:hypothetical protein
MGPVALGLAEEEVVLVVLVDVTRVVEAAEETELELDELALDVFDVVEATDDDALVELED